MKRSLFILTLFCLLCSGINAQQKKDPLTAVFDSIIARQFSANETGVSVLVSKKGNIIYHKASGMANLELGVPMQIDNVSRIGSITKQFTAVAILQLMEQGKLRLQDEITQFIPGYPTQGHKITIEHLLTHTSGILDFTGIKNNAERSVIDYTPVQMIDYFKDQPLRFAPGTKWEYSNSGYFLLGYIIEKITGNTYGKYLEENFFRPLGMKHSFYANDSSIIKNRATGYTFNRSNKSFENARYISMTQPYAAGSIQSTVEDLFIWNQAVQANKLISKETLKRAMTRYKLTDSIETNYGYGWRLGYNLESPTAWHGGLINGSMSVATYLPKEEVFIAVLTNCDCKSPIGVAEKLAALAAGKNIDHTPISLEDTLLRDYTGIYENAKGQERVISITDKGLSFQAGKGPKSTIYSFEKDKFFFKEDPMTTLAFSRNKSNNVDRLIIHTRTENEVWSKTGKSITTPVEIKVSADILQTYVGEYEINPHFKFAITLEENRLYLEAPGQGKVEIFAEADNKFYLKENGAQLEFIKDESGKIIKSILTQGGRQTDATKVK